MTAIDTDIGRICPFTAQQCTRKVGCGVFGRAVVRPDNLDDKLHALNCRERGMHLFADEVRTKVLRPHEHTEKDRERYAGMVRSQLHARRRKLLQLSLDGSESDAGTRERSAPMAR